MDPRCFLPSVKQYTRNVLQNLLSALFVSIFLFMPMTDILPIQAIIQWIHCGLSCSFCTAHHMCYFVLTHIFRFLSVNRFTAQTHNHSVNSHLQKLQKMSFLWPILQHSCTFTLIHCLTVTLMYINLYDKSQHQCCVHLYISVKHLYLWLVKTYLNLLSKSNALNA